MWRGIYASGEENARSTSGFVVGRFAATEQSRGPLLTREPTILTTFGQPLLAAELADHFPRFVWSQLCRAIVGFVAGNQPARPLSAGSCSLFSRSHGTNLPRAAWLVLVRAAVRRVVFLLSVLMISCCGTSAAWLFHGVELPRPPRDEARFADLALACVEPDSFFNRQATRVTYSPDRGLLRHRHQLAQSVWFSTRFTAAQRARYLGARVSLGKGAFGLPAAAEVRFGRPLESLTTEEVALLVGLAQYPRAKAPERRVPHVLRRLRECGLTP